MATKPVADRKTQLLDVGAKLASKHGHTNVTRRMVAKAAQVSEALVSSYLGDTATAQKAFAARARKLGLTLPTKAEAEALGVKLRAHGPRKNPVVRKRAAKEVEAIKRKTFADLKGKAPKVAAKKSKPAGTAARKPAAAKPTVVAPVIEQPKTAARAPKAPPSDPAPAPFLPPLPLPLMPSL